MSGGTSETGAIVQIQPRRELQRQNTRSQRKNAAATRAARRKTGAAAQKRSQRRAERSAIVRQSRKERGTWNWLYYHRERGLQVENCENKRAKVSKIENARTRKADLLS